MKIYLKFYFDKYKFRIYQTDGNMKKSYGREKKGNKNKMMKTNYTTKRYVCMPSQLQPAWKLNFSRTSLNDLYLNKWIACVVQNHQKTATQAVTWIFVQKQLFLIKIFKS